MAREHTEQEQPISVLWAALCKYRITSTMHYFRTQARGQMSKDQNKHCLSVAKKQGKLQLATMKTQRVEPTSSVMNKMLPASISTGSTCNATLTYCCCQAGQKLIFRAKVKNNAKIQFFIRTKNYRSNTWEEAKKNEERARWLAYALGKRSYSTRMRVIVVLIYKRRADG